MKKILFEGKTYPVSFEPMPDILGKKLGKEVLQTYLQLLEKVQTQPRKYYQEIKTFCSKYPDSSEVVNLLTFAHLQNKNLLEAEKLIEETYWKYPHYLFARINYADQCIRKKKLSEINKIFPLFDLKILYPEKKIFHISELRGYWILMAHYHQALKNREKALDYYETVCKIDPYHSATLHLKKKLIQISFTHRFFLKLSNGLRPLLRLCNFK